MTSSDYILVGVGQEWLRKGIIGVAAEGQVREIQLDNQI
jgi:hypothetical protein